MAHFTINMCWESLRMYSPHLLLKLILHHFWTVLLKVTSKTLYESSKTHGFNEKTVCECECLEYTLRQPFGVHVCKCMCFVVSFSGNGCCYRRQDVEVLNVWSWWYWPSSANKAHDHLEPSLRFLHAVDRQYFSWSTIHTPCDSVFSC